MSMGKRDRQPAMWVTTTDLPTAASHPFYRRLNLLLHEHGFDDFAETQCASFYAETMGRPGLSPGIYFRLLSAISKALTRSVALPGARRIRSRCAIFWASDWTTRRPTTRRFRGPVG